MAVRNLEAAIKETSESEKDRDFEKILKKSFGILQRRMIRVENNEIYLVELFGLLKKRIGRFASSDGSDLILDSDYWRSGEKYSHDFEKRYWQKSNVDLKIGFQGSYFRKTI